MIVLSTLMLLSCENSERVKEQTRQLPAEKFDLRQWQLNTPTDTNNDGIVDEIDVPAIQTYQHKDYFYLDEQDNLVFAAPNKAITSVNSTNTRSELHHMLGEGKVAARSFANNFTLTSNRRANEFAQEGGNLQAKLKVNHVSKRAKYSEKPTAFSVVVGQVHAVQDKNRRAEGEG